MRPNRFRTELKALRLGAGQVAFYSERADVILVAALDDGYPSPEGGYGGWEDAALPGQMSATVFRGTAAPRLPLRLILGGWPVDPLLNRDNCRQQIDKLDKLALPLGPARGQRPPLLRVYGDVRHRGARWFVDDLVWGDAIFDRGSIMRAFVTVTLRRFVAVQVTTAPYLPFRRTNRIRRYVVHEGENASTLARRLGAAGSAEAKAIARTFQWAEGRRRGRTVRDPRRIRPGDVLLLPEIIE